MAQKAVISLITDMEDPERVTVAFLVAVGVHPSATDQRPRAGRTAVRLRPPRFA